MVNEMFRNIIINKAGSSLGAHMRTNILFILFLVNLLSACGGSGGWSCG